jgi:hypothetical protein
VRKHPRQGTLEQDAGPLGARPAKRIKPPGQTKSDLSICELAIAIAGTDFFDMDQALPVVLVVL